MCFSATASFAAGAVLIPAGAYCIRNAVARDRRYLGLAVIPVVFGLQQVCEGLVWVGLGHDAPDLARGAAVAFLLFAHVFWPAWCPLSVRPLESRPWARHALLAASCLAFFFGLLYLLPPVLRARDWLRPEILHHSLRYNLEWLDPFLGIPSRAWQLGYLGVVAAPLAVRGNRRLTIFSLMVVASALIAHVLFAYAFLSIWCAFAAILSLWLCFLFHGLPLHPGREA